MRAFSLRVGILALLSGHILASDLEKRACAADNCLRQIEATRPAAQLHMASSDCSSYLARSTTTVTITPGLGKTLTAGTSTKTVKITTTQFVATATNTDVEVSVVYIKSVSTVIIPGKRAATETVPAYASACTAPGQYASACSCYGVGPAFTVTATAHSIAPATVTKTITTTILAKISATKTTAETSTSTHIITHKFTETIAASSFSLTAVGAPLDGYYLNDEDFEPTLEPPDFGFVLPTYFTLSKKNGGLYQGTAVAVSSVDDYNYVTWQDGIANNDPTRLSCTVAGGYLNCQTPQGFTTFYGCLDESGEEFPPSLYMFPPNSESTVPFGCYPIKFAVGYAT